MRMLKKILMNLLIVSGVFAYHHGSKTGPVAGVMINRKHATARQTLLNRKVAHENGDPNIRAIEDDEICVGIKKNDFVDTRVDEDRYDTKKS